MRFSIRTSILTRLGLLFALVWAALAGSGVFGWRRVSAEVSDRAQAEAGLAANAVATRLDDSERLFGSATRAALSALEAAARGHGPPRLVPAVLGAAPTLSFGRYVANSDERLVNAVTARLGQAVVIYVLDKGAFIPIASSLKTDRGAGDWSARVAADSPIRRQLVEGRAVRAPMAVS
jgi:hypothetical protein